MNRPRLGRDVFGRGDPEPVGRAGRPVYGATLYDLLSAYARQAQKHANVAVRLRTRSVWSLADAREILTRLIGRGCDWTAFDDWLIEACVDPKLRRSARASSFSASLELVREGKIELRQDKIFAPIWIRPRTAAVEEAAA